MDRGGAIDRRNDFSGIRDCLVDRITDIDAEAREIATGDYRRLFRSFVAGMCPGDELWRWETSGQHGVRRFHSAGWCIVRDDEVIDSHCYAET